MTRYQGRKPHLSFKAQCYGTWQAIRKARIEAEANRQAARIIGEADIGELHDLRIQELKRQEQIAYDHWLAAKF